MKYCGLVLWNFYWTFYRNAFQGWINTHSDQAMGITSVILSFLCNSLDTFWWAPHRKAPLFLPESRLWLCDVNSCHHTITALCGRVCEFMCETRLLLSVVLQHSPHRQPSPQPVGGCRWPHLVMPGLRGIPQSLVRDCSVCRTHGALAVLLSLPLRPTPVGSAFPVFPSLPLSPAPFSLPSNGLYHYLLQQF